LLSVCLSICQVRDGSSGAPISRGTRITLHLKEDAWEYADEKKLAALIKQYSEFIAFPIKLLMQKCARHKCLSCSP
jgi:HSP90 family molecular chaperone